jgi:hypothetical protein
MLIALLTLALGIGATAGVFSLIQRRAPDASAVPAARKAGAGSLPQLRWTAIRARLGRLAMDTLAAAG